MAFGDKILKIMKKNQRQIEVAVNKQTIKDQVIAMLYAFKLLKDSEDVIDIDFTMAGDNSTTMVKIYLTADSRGRGGVKKFGKD